MENWPANARMSLDQPPPSQWPISAVIAHLSGRRQRQPYPLPENMTVLIRYEDLAPNPRSLPGPDRADAARNVPREHQPDPRLLRRGPRLQRGSVDPAVVLYEPFLD
jgi:hypothetical protein